MQYAAFFRGINVGGKHIVKMAQLKQLFSNLGFQDVQTYIQSGNVIFSTGETAPQAMDSIQKGFFESFGFESAVMLRSAEEIADIIQNLPFCEEEISEAQTSNPAVEHLYLYLLDRSDIDAQLEELMRGYTGSDQIRFRSKEIYLLCHNSIRDSKLAASLGKLDASLTARNWKTMNKLYQMMQESKD